MDVTKEIFRLISMSDDSRFGAIAQLVEHLHGMQGVRGSNPLGSITLKKVSYLINRNESKGQLVIT